MTARRWTTADGDNPAPSAPKTWPCRSQDVPCPCHCHAIVTGLVNTTRTRASTWLPKHDELLTKMARAGVAPFAIAERLTRARGIRTTQSAIRNRMKRKGLSTRDGWLCREEVRHMLGVGRQRLADWERDGVLIPEPYGAWMRYPIDSVEAFVKEQAGILFDPRRVADPRLRSLAETSAAVNRRKVAS